MFKWLPVLAALCVAGCFNEPEPAYKTVPAGARVYLQDKGLKTAPLPENPQIVDYINLDRNSLTNIDALAALDGLKWLRLNDNRLSSLPDLGRLVKLRRIYLRNNRFESVPETLKNLPELTDIDLSGNPVSEVPEWLARKQGLKNLSFSATRLKSLPADLSAWKSLHSLQLGELSLSAEEMKRIRDALPDVAIVF
jgi:Leucine-rich repeat (LRR) protein